MLCLLAIYLTIPHIFSNLKVFKKFTGHVIQCHIIVNIVEHIGKILTCQRSIKDNAHIH